MRSRKLYSKQVAELIEGRHAASDESYIFGISGKWGEGKTEFLKDLRGVLEKTHHFQVIDVNPWKYGKEKITFLRYFIKVLAKELSYPEDLSELDFDSSSTSIKWLDLFLWIIGLVFLYFLTLLFTFGNNGNLIFLVPILTLIALPLSIAAAGKSVSFKRTSHAVATLDRFDQLLDNVLNFAGEKKLVIFVDDLDRVSPTMARDLLDNLRTFFDEKRLTFVVAGDHTVLERYIGMEILPNGAEPEQLDEGRRFLKKIFNIHWRLPLPIDKEFNDSLEKILADRKQKLEEIFSKDDLRVLVLYLKKYFDKNFRHVIRFLETTIFTFKTIRINQANSDDSSRSYFDEMLQHPLLVVRVLMMQDFCAPLFEEMMRDSTLLSDLDRFAATGRVNEFSSRLKPFVDRFTLSAQQQSFISEFAYENPQFSDGYNLVVTAVEPFLHFAADVSLGDSRGPLPEDIPHLFKKSDIDQLYSTIEGSGPVRAKSMAVEFTKLYNQVDSTDMEKKYLLVSSLVSALSLVNDKHVAHSAFLEVFRAIDLEWIKSVTDDHRKQLLPAFWSWLDKFSGDQGSFDSLFSFKKPEDLEIAASIHDGGVTSTRITLNWLKEYRGLDMADALEYAIRVLPNLQRDLVEKDCEQIQEDLLSNLNASPASRLGLSSGRILIQFTPRGIELVRKSILEKLTRLDESAWTWLSKQFSDNAVIKRDEAEAELIRQLSLATDRDKIITILYYCANKISVSKPIWDEILKKDHALIISVLQEIGHNNHYEELVPSESIAVELANIIFDEAFRYEPEQNQKPIYQLLMKNRWIWSNLSKLDGRRLKALDKDIFRNIYNDWNS